MATLALFAVGSAIGGALAPAGAVVAFGLTGAAIGGFVGGTIGSLIDSAFLFPAIFGSENISGPRLQDQPIMTGQEGAPIHWVLGPKNRVGGTVIWKSPLITEKTNIRIGKGGGSSVPQFKHFLDIAIGICDTTNLPGNKIKRIVQIFGDTKIIWNGTDDFVDMYDGLTIYDGSQTTTDPLIVSYKGEANTPIHKNLSFIVINRLRLEDFGNRPPNITAVVEQANPFTLQEGVDLIMQRAGYEPSEFSVNRMDQCLNGYTISGPQQMSRVLAPLMLAFTINVQERDEVITFLPKGEEDQVTVTDVGDLAARSPGDDVPRPLETIDNDDFDVPSEVVVRFLDHLRDNEQGSQRQPRWDHVQQNRITLDLPIVMHPTEALNIAKRYLWSAEAERQRVSLSLPPQYIGIREGMSLLVPGISGRARNIWVRRVAIGANFNINVEGTFFEPDTYTAESELDDKVDDDGIYIPPETVAVIADMPNMSSDTEDRIGLVYAVAALDPEAQWRGAELWRSSNDSDFDKEAGAPAEAVIGTTESGHIYREAGPHRWDRVSNIVVKVFEGGLETASEDDVLNGVNRAAIQSQTGEFELIAFSVATLLSPRTYRLTNLLRGLRGTAHLIDQHTAFSQRFIFGERSALRAIERSFGDNSYWKMPSIGGALSDFSSQRVLVEGRSMRPFSPHRVTGVYAENGDLTISWFRRMKYIRGLFASKPLPDDERPMTFEIDIIQGNHPDFGIVVRTIVVEGARTVVYPFSEQQDDGISGVPVAASLFQISQTVGRSPRQFTIFRR